MGTSFSALIFASISSQTSALFWNMALRRTQKQENTDRTTQSTKLRNLLCSTESLLHLLSQLLRVLPDGLRQLRHWIQHQVVQNHLRDKERDEPERHTDVRMQQVMVSLAHCSHCRPMSSSSGAGPADAAPPPRPAHWSRRNLIISTKTLLFPDQSLGATFSTNI